MDPMAFAEIARLSQVMTAAIMPKGIKAGFMVFALLMTLVTFTGADCPDAGIRCRIPASDADTTVIAAWPRTSLEMDHVVDVPVTRLDPRKYNQLMSCTVSRWHTFEQNLMQLQAQSLKVAILGVSQARLESRSPNAESASLK